MITRQFIKDFLTYSAGSVVAQVSNMLLILLVMHRLPAHQVGFLSLSFSVVLALSTLISCGLRQFFMFEFFTLDARGKRELVNDILCIYSAVALPFIFCAWIFYAQSNYYFFAGVASPFVYGVLMAQTVLTFFTELLYQALMYTLKSMQVTILKSLVAAAILLSSCAVLYYLQAGIDVVIMLQCTSLCVVVWYGAWHYGKARIWNYFSLIRSVQNAKCILAKSFPLMPTVFAGIALASGNRWLLSQQGDLAAVAVYALADYVTPLFNLLILYPLSGAYLPRIMAHLQQQPLPAVEAENKRLMYVCMAFVFAIGTLVYGSMYPFAYALLPAQYHAAVPGAYAIALGNILLMGTYFTSAIIIFTKKSIWLLRAMVLAALANSALSYALIPHWGINGCFVSYVLAYVLYFLLVYRDNKAIVHACVTHAADQQGIQQRLVYQAATTLQEEVPLPSSHKKEFSKEPEHKNF